MKDLLELIGYFALSVAGVTILGILADNIRQVYKQVFGYKKKDS